jgi:hypothetical protein
MIPVETVILRMMAASLPFESPWSSSNRTKKKDFSAYIATVQRMSEPQ